eukprot:1159929-Pelagomonas_calceolata.AAC.26
MTELTQLACLSCSNRTCPVYTSRVSLLCGNHVCSDDYSTSCDCAWQSSALTHGWLFPICKTFPNPPSARQSCLQRWLARPAAAPGLQGARRLGWRGCSAPHAPFPGAQSPSHAASAAPAMTMQ